VSSRNIEVFFLVVMAIAVLIGGPALLVQLVVFKSLAVVILTIFGVFIIYAFRQSYRANRPGARLAATRDTAFLATIGAAIAFIISPARWSLGAAVVGFEIGIIVEIIARFAPPPRVADDTDAGTGVR
jgi:hypothetical protein